MTRGTGAGATAPRPHVSRVITLSIRRSARFQHHLIAAAKEALALCDVALVTVDAAARLTDERRALLQALMVETAQAGVRPWLVLNKMDLVKPRWRPHKEEEYRAAAAAAFPTLTEVFAISAQHGTGVPELRQRLLAAAPEGEWCVARVRTAWPRPRSDVPWLRMYAAEAHTDLSKLAQVEELVRAKVFKVSAVPCRVVHAPTPRRASVHVQRGALPGHAADAGVA